MNDDAAKACAALTAFYTSAHFERLLKHYERQLFEAMAMPIAAPPSLGPALDKLSSVHTQSYSAPTIINPIDLDPESISRDLAASMRSFTKSSWTLKSKVWGSGLSPEEMSEKQAEMLCRELDKAVSDWRALAAELEDSEDGG